MHLRSLITVFPGSILIFGERVAWYVCQGDSRDLFLTPCLCQIKYGSLQIWVSGSFMLRSYSELLIQPCLSCLQHTAHSCLDGASQNFQRGGSGATLKIAPASLRWDIFCCVGARSLRAGVICSRYHTVRNRSVSLRGRDSTSGAFANWSGASVCPTKCGAFTFATL